MKTILRETLLSPVAWLCFLGTFAIGLSADLVSKSLAVEHLKDSTSILLVPKLIKLEYTENRGAVFGIGQGQRPLFLIVSIAAIGFLGYLFVTSGKMRTYQIILGMLMAGVLGNMYDRVCLGHVRDMIHGLPGVYWPDWLVRMFPASWQPMIPGVRIEVFPWIFNIADSLLLVGVVAMIVYSFLSERQRKHLTMVAEETGQKLGSKDQ